MRTRRPESIQVYNFHKCGVEYQTLLTNLFKIMRLSKRPPVPRQETFERFLGRLLAMENGLIQ